MIPVLLIFIPVISGLITFLLKNGNAQIFVIDILGQCVLSANTTEPTNSIDISAFKTGVYTIKILTENGQSVQKIIKE